MKDPLTCTHENWAIFGGTRFGMGTCLDCNSEVYLFERFNALKQKMEASIQEMRSMIAHYKERNQR